MGIAVDVLFGSEKFSLLLEHEADFHVEVHIGLRLFGVVGILDELTLPGLVSLDIDVLSYKLRIEFVDHVEAAAEVNHRADLAGAVYEFQRWNVVLVRYSEVICAECARDVDDTGTVLGRHVVAGDHAEGIAVGRHPGDELLVAHAGQLGAFVFGYNFPGDKLIAGFIVGQSNIFGFGIEYRVE